MENKISLLIEFARKKKLVCINKKGKKVFKKISAISDTTTETKGKILTPEFQNIYVISLKINIIFFILYLTSFLVKIQDTLMHNSD